VNFNERYGPWAIIAGASEGTGRSFARKVAARGVSCILIANDGPLEEVAEEIHAESGIECITAKIDLAAPDAIDHILSAVGNREIGLYVANAGGDASASRFHDRDFQTWLNLTHLNVVTTMHACHHFGGLMMDRHHGGLLIVNSGACYGGGSYLAVYSAAKAFLLNFCEALWAELSPAGVDVLSIVLDKTDTPNFRRLQAKIGQPMPTDIASPDDVAEMGLTHLGDGPLYNFGLADDEAGQGWQSASARRKRVEAMSASIMRLYGKTEAK
jgi:short-subunit dehydrogenase